MSQETQELYNLIEEYPFHFVLNSPDGLLLEKVNVLGLHKVIVGVEDGQYLIFFDDDVKMNQCIRKIHNAIYKQDPSRFSVL